MKVKYIENGRFPQAIWIDSENNDFLTEYLHSKAISIGIALDLWKGLTAALVKSGQRGTLDAGMKEVK